MRRSLLAAFFLAAQIYSLPGYACSAFAGGNGNIKVMGKSYDWMMSHGIALVNKRHVAKTALIASVDSPVKWTSKYGSVTYTQVGREFPLSGLNEKGLAVEILWDYSNEGPNGKGALPAINEIQWIQYQLDMSASVKEAIANAKSIKIKKVYAEVHYLACDRSGACAAFEFSKDKVIINEISAQSSLRALTNSDYQQSANYSKNYSGLGGKKEIPWGSYKSEDRFVILAARNQELNASPTVDAAVRTSFDMLKGVRNIGSSVWNIVHDLNNNVSHFKRMFEEKKTMTTHFDRLDFSCKTPVQILDLESGLEGDVTEQYADYDEALNRSTAELTGAGLGIAKELVRAVADYPSSTRCTE